MVSRAILCGTLIALASVAACTNTVVARSTPDAGSSTPGDDPPEAVPTADAAPVADSGTSTCAPASKAGFSKAEYWPPSGKHQGVCTDRQIAAWWECLKGTTASCAEKEPDGGHACEWCLETPTDSAFWGPMVYPATGGGEVIVNTAGCGALEHGDTSTSGCGQALANYEGCLHHTCLPKCRDDYQSCATESGETECNAYMVAAKAACPKGLGDCYARPGESEESLIRRLMKRFCGSP